MQMQRITLARFDLKSIKRSLFQTAPVLVLIYFNSARKRLQIIYSQPLNFWQGTAKMKQASLM